MTRKDLLSGIQDIFRDIFDEEEMIIEGKTNPDDIEDWDSLNHINIVNAIEKEFKVKFTLNELMNLKNVGDMIDIVRNKLTR